MLGYSKLLANRTVNTIAQELRADGNERAATALANTSKAANMLVAAIATKGLSLIPQTISSVAQQVVRQRAAVRDTQRAELETRLKGGRSNFNQGSVHFD
jgi:regulator of protease activity HflC (stomatin/prohibitin superfamily)